MSSFPLKNKTDFFCVQLEFFLNDFLWIEQIQWIMTKSKTSMVTRDIQHLTIVTFLDVVVKKNFPLLPVDWYLSRVVLATDTYPEVVMKIHFILLALVMYLLADG